MKPVAISAALPAGASTQVSGTLLSIDGPKLTILTRTGKIFKVDAATAMADERVANLIVGRPYTVLGSASGASSVVALAITRAKPGSGAWPVDQL